MKLVKVARVGEKVQQLALPDNANVNTALIAAGRLPFSNEDIWLNHQIVAITADIRNGETLILEPRQRKLVSRTIKKVIDILVDNDLIDWDDYEDGNGDMDYELVYNDFGKMLEDIGTAVKEV